jgi:hypothetical protein
MKETLQRCLATVLVHIRRADAAIAAQKATIRYLEESNLDAHRARTLLSGFEDIKRADEELRDTLLAQLDRC